MLEYWTELLILQIINKPIDILHYSNGLHLRQIILGISDNLV